MLSKLLLTFMAAVLFSATSLCQSFPTMLKHADSLYNSKLFKESAACYEKAIHSISEIYVQPSVFYNCACLYSLAGKPSKSFHYLKKAINLGGITPNELISDKDFENLKNDKRWNEVIASAKVLENKLNLNLIEELKDIAQTDQKYRRKLDSLYSNKIINDSVKDFYKKTQAKIDSFNLIKVKKILENGYPSRIQVGKYNETIFNVIQHSDLVNMELYINLFTDAAKKGDLSWQAVSLMVDRIQKRKGQKQIYGTQFIRKDGKMSLYEVEDREHLNERRAKIGLSTIEEEIKFWNAR